MQSVKTEFVNVMQQDLPILKSFDADKILRVIQDNNYMDVVRYSYNTNRYHEDWTKKYCDKVFPSRKIVREGLTFTLCSQWSDNNHIAKVKHYSNVVWPNTRPYSFMEHQLLCYMVKIGYEKIWYLGDLDDGNFINHTDGRANSK